MVVFTIGFGKKSARQFFTLLQEHNVKRVIDIRLNNVSQLAGYTKKTDLEYFLKVIAGMEYLHIPEFAPTKEILDGYKKGEMSWLDYEQKYNELLTARNHLQRMDQAVFDNACLLCSEPTAQQCHRRLLAEHLAQAIPELQVKHL